MHWSEEGIILSARRHGETSVIAEVFTRGHGRYAGLVHGGRSRSMRAVLQPGNLVAATWRARLSEHLGVFAIEPVALKAAALIDDPFKLAGLTTLTTLAHLVPEREAHARLHDAFRYVLAALDDDDLWPALLVRWELGLLEELGFGLDLSRCAATGENRELVYVSPKTGRAVSADAGAPYSDRLLALPAFLLGGGEGPSSAEICEGFALTGHFLVRHVLEPRGLKLPEARARIVSRLAETA